MAIKLSNNQTIVAKGGVFQCNVSKSIDLLIFDAMQQVRLCKERPDSSRYSKKYLKLKQIILQKKISKTGLKV